MFGHQVPLDPLKGDPYVWCRIVGRVLTLYSLQITDDGGYDLQIYERTVGRRAGCPCISGGFAKVNLPRN